MNEKAFLIDITKNIKPGKYFIVVQTLSTMAEGLMKTDPSETAKELISTLSGDSLVEILDQFQEAFYDLEGLELAGVARITSRLFLNMRGLEFSIWTTKDEVYTIFLACLAAQLGAVISKESGYAVDSREFHDLLNRFHSTVHHYIFPPYSSIEKRYIQE